MKADLGSTPDGAAWCLKALHPSDPLLDLRGIPDINCAPSTVIAYQSTFKIGPAPDNGTANWNFVAQFHPNPVNFGYYCGVADDGTLKNFVGFPNSQISGPTIEAKATTWKSITDRWRLAYFGVTIHCDAPALADQGTLVCCQRPYEPRTRTFSAKNVDNVYVTFPEFVFPDAGGLSGSTGPDFPNYSATVGYPNSYMGQAKKGLYIPLKLTRSFQSWHSDSDMVCWALSANAAGDPDNSAIKLPGAPYFLSYPHPNLPGSYMNAAGTALTCYPMPVDGSDIVADVCGRNIASTTGFVVEVRAGFEIQALPGTLYSPLLKSPCGYDAKAVEAYALVARELKDAYESDYNDLGKLWNTIKQICGYLAPVLGAVPKVGMILGPAAAALGVTASSSHGERAQAASASQIERAQDVVRAEMRAAPRRVRTLRVVTRGAQPSRGRRVGGTTKQSKRGG